jgi:uncharacterized protein (TIGR02266 family)
MSGTARSAELRAAREGRAVLAGALAGLQQTEGSAPESVIESIANASSTLFELERSEPGSAEYRGIRTAISHLAQALNGLQALDTSHGVESAIEAVARTLALLYPIARTHQRRRRRVILDIFGEPDSGLDVVPPAPEPTGRAPDARAFDGADKRAGGERVFVEVDIGLLSESHFYTGLTRDISNGGVFVATYDPKPPGTPVRLYLVLPNGRAVSASGVVRWTSEARAEIAPGMGIAFEDLSQEDLDAIAEFCASRPPLYHCSADD